MVFDTSASQLKLACKFRDMMLNYNASHLVNLDLIRYMVLGTRKSTANVQTVMKIKRKSKGSATVSTITESEENLYRNYFINPRRLEENSPSISVINMRGFTRDSFVFIACLNMSEDLKFKHPFLCIVSGPSVSSISSFCILFLR